MNYVILNGKKSTLIKGLMIQSLPFVSKPLIRTEIEEIDGRDGDIVTKLGYSAYDREMSIGLFGDFDICEVINFFNSEGEAIFSNEPDKIYKYQVLDQIDFERLLRFRTAVVKFHVQPFKYSSVPDSKTVTTGSQTFVKNYGNVVSRPILEVYTENGFTSPVTLKINDDYTLTIKEPDDVGLSLTTISIDTATMIIRGLYPVEINATRYVKGNLMGWKMAPNSDTKISWTGALTQLTIKNISRWI
jgi:predicted phage tail component-like protein